MKKNNYISNILIFSILFNILYISSFAEIKKQYIQTKEEKIPSKLIEKRIQAIKRKPNKVYNIPLQTDFVTQIELQDDDIILYYSIANKEHINIKTRKNTIILTPVAKNIDTNIIVTTKNNKKYMFHIKSYGKNENNENSLYYLKIY